MCKSGFSGPAAYRDPRGWWRRPWSLLSRIWHIFDVYENEHEPAASPRRSRWFKTFVLVAILPVLPILWLLRPRWLRSVFGMSAAKKLEAEARERWTTNPHEALLLLKHVCHTLREARRADRITPWRGSVEIPPYGRFRFTDSVVLDDVLYSYAYSLGDYEAAMDLCSEPPLLASMIDRQVDCLVAMRRQKDAVALLQKNLHLDNRRGDLHRRLGELSGGQPGGPAAIPDQSN